mgnify:CR=1 FL=1
MILTFSEPKFEDLIIRGEKWTTFREDKKNRWKVGVTANLWMHNPRNVRLNPHHIKDEIIHKIEYVVINFVKNEITYCLNENYTGRYYKHTLKSKFSDDSLKLDHVANVDGFENWEEMKDWFIKRGYTDPKGYKMKRLIFHKF